MLDHWQGRLPALFTDEDVHSGFLAAVTGLAVGLVLTDSGIAVPSTGAMVLLPYLLALCADRGLSGAGPDLAENGPDRRASAGRVGSAGRTADRGTSVTPGTDTNGSVR